VPRPDREAHGDEGDALAVEAVDRDKLDGWFLQKHHDALYHMAPHAFRYYLPAFLILAVEASDITPLFVSPVIQMLDPGPDESFWSDGFKGKWLSLTVDELDAVKAWLVHLASTNSGDWDDVALARSFDTVDRLMGGSAA
jgi:hypothetical protein